MDFYERLKQEIKDTLEGRPAGHEIQPLEHQTFALDMLEYLRSVELITTSTLVGYAESNTTPVVSDRANATYISAMPNSSTMTFYNFAGEDGSPITVTTGSDSAAVIILLWDKKSWSSFVIPIEITAISDLTPVMKIVELQKDLTTNIKCGGVNVGTFYPKGTSVLDIVEDMLYTYLPPTLSLTVTPSPSNFEKGETKNVTFTFKAVNSSSTTITEELLVNSTPGKEAELSKISSPVSNQSYTHTVNGITTNSTFQLRVTDNANKVTTADASVNFYLKYFGGFVAQNALPTTSAAVRALTKYSNFVTSNSVTVVGATNTSATAYYLVMVVPSGYTIQVQNSLGGDYAVIDGGKIDVHIGGGGTSQPTEAYNIYYIGGTPTFKNLKIVKK